jgi:cytochrome c553
MSPYAFIRPFVLSVLATAAFAAHAGDGRIPTDQDKLPKGVAVAPAVAAQCMACHGPGGQSQYDDWPALAGQKQSYLLQQLQDFKSGARKDPMMAPVVVNLSDADMKKLAEHFSKQAPLQPRQPLAANVAAPAAAAACMACHDNAALPSEPFLHGQKAAYLTEQIKAFRDGKRKNAVMEAMTKPLSDADITAIAEHFSRLAPVAPVAAAKK